MHGEEEKYWDLLNYLDDKYKTSSKLEENMINCGFLIHNYMETIEINKCWNCRTNLGPCLVKKDIYWNECFFCDTICLNSWLRRTNHSICNSCNNISPYIFGRRINRCKKCFLDNLLDYMSKNLDKP